MLTTVNYPGEEMGRTAARQLINQADGNTSQDLTNTIILKSKLIIRASTLRNKP
jgi:LacI family transcriptional regulator